MHGRAGGKAGRECWMLDVECWMLDCSTIIINFPILALCQSLTFQFKLAPPTHTPAAAGVGPYHHLNHHPSHYPPPPSSTSICSTGLFLHLFLHQSLLFQILHPLFPGNLHHGQILPIFIHKYIPWQSYHRSTSPTSVVGSCAVICSGDRSFSGTLQMLVVPNL